MSIFKSIPKISFPELEEQILKVWHEQDTFRRSVEERPKDREYLFYDGPPFATGLPHYGHLVASTLKDIVPRYWTMRGRRVERRFGWDTHGLPIEMEMEKTLGLSGPTSVKNFGVAKFNEACRSNVLRYTQEWERTVRRLGRWVDFENDYKTMDLSFMESLWWVFGRLWEEGLIYEDFRVMPFSWRLSTSLSNFEANQDYRDVQDPAITVAMPLVDGPEVLLIWTTTPWTLPSNLAIAVGRDLEYLKLRRPGDETIYILGRDAAERTLGKDLEILEVLKGSDLEGRSYLPLFDYFKERAELEEGRCFQLLHADHVTAEEGTGLVHMAPDFGEEDFKACRKLGIELLQSVDDEGRFRPMIRDWAGINVKEADPQIVRAIKEMGRLIRHSTVQHSYPFCWRSSTPLIYKAVPARFVKVTALRDRMYQHNQSIHWVPESVGSKRFGNWIKDARDWNISRNRFWGTPIPIWACVECNAEICISSIQELEERTGSKVDDLHPHRIDHLSCSCERCGAEMRRISAVFDCWFESGAMPYAQGHYPFEGRDSFQIPAEFIAEGLDQTRGWFYTLLVLSTALFDKPPFKNVIVNGMVLAEDGSKMSKSKRNYPPPDEVIGRYGADALRAYLINSPIVRAEPLSFSEEGVREVVRTVLLPLRSAWSFFLQYAKIDDWSPQGGLAGLPSPLLSERPKLDRWIISVLQSLVAEVNQQMEGYYLYRVVPPTVGFIDQLTNWYIRRSRRRFWRSAADETGRQDKAAAYATLYEVLTTFSKVVAPVLPFISEALYQSLVVEPGVEGPKSVHLCDFPEVEEQAIDKELEREISLIRQTVRMGRALRERHKLKTRQPLRQLTVVHHDPAICAAVERHREELLEELNVKRVVARSDDADLAELSFKANFKRLGRRLGRKMKAAAAEISALRRETWEQLQEGDTLEIQGVQIEAEDLIVSRQPKGDVVIQVEGALTLALETELDEELLKEGLLREALSRLQRARKEAGLAVTDQIHLELGCSSPLLRGALESHQEFLCSELLACSLEIKVDMGAEPISLEGHLLSVKLQRATSRADGNRQA